MKRRSIKVISTSLILLLGIINIVLFSFFTYSPLKNNIEMRFFKEAELVSKHTVLSFESMFSTAENMVDLLAGRMTLLENRDITGLGDLEVIMGSASQLIPGAHLLMYGLESGDYYSSTNFDFPNSYDPRNREWYLHSLETEGNELFWSDPFLDYIDQTIVVSLSKKVYTPEGKFRGVLAAFFDVRTISTTIAKSNIGEEGFVMLLSRKGQVIANRGDFFIGKYILGDGFKRLSMEGKGSLEITINNKSYHILAESFDMNDMMIVAAISKNEIISTLWSSFLPLFSTAFLVLLAFIFITYFFVRVGITPLEKLTLLMNKAERGDYEVEADFQTYLEVASLSHSFNSMILGIRNRDEVLKHREIKIKNLAYYDSLTGLPNRAQLLKSLKKELNNTEEVERKGALLYIDLDRFKIINDTMGHTTGDKVLNEVGKKISHNLRYGQLAARIGGDEFIILLPGIDTAETVTKITRRLLEILNSPVVVEGKSFDTSASVGVVFYPIHGREVDILLKNADMAMYKAKRNGKNCFQFFEDHIETEILTKLNIEVGIRDALKKKKFMVHYQPQFTISDNALYGLEALLRAEPPLNTYTTQEIIQTAEETGQIIEIEKFVLEEVCNFTKVVNNGSGRNIKITVNISPVHIMQHNFLQNLITIFEKTGVDRHYIELEITETAIMNSHETNSAKLKDLQKLGIGIHMDDFGTGYSSLSYLQHLPINYVKIDKSFIDALESNTKKSKITSVIIDLAHNLNLNVIAEGVETPEQYRILHSYNCDMAQGFYLAKPADKDQTLEMIDKSNCLHSALLPELFL